MIQPCCQGLLYICAQQLVFLARCPVMFPKQEQKRCDVAISVGFSFLGRMYQSLPNKLTKLDCIRELLKQSAKFLSTSQVNTEILVSLNDGTVIIAPQIMLFFSCFFFFFLKNILFCPTVFYFFSYYYNFFFTILRWQQIDDRVSRIDCGVCRLSDSPCSIDLPKLFCFFPLLPFHLRLFCVILKFQLLILLVIHKLFPRHIHGRSATTATTTQHNRNLLSDNIDILINLLLSLSFPFFCLSFMTN